MDREWVWIPGDFASKAFAGADSLAETGDVDPESWKRIRDSVLSALGLVAITERTVGDFDRDHQQFEGSLADSPPIRKGGEESSCSRYALPLLKADVDAFLLHSRSLLQALPVVFQSAFPSLNLPATIEGLARELPQATAAIHEYARRHLLAVAKSIPRQNSLFRRISDPGSEASPYRWTSWNWPIVEHRWGILGICETKLLNPLSTAEGTPLINCLRSDVSLLRTFSEDCIAGVLTASTLDF